MIPSSEPQNQNTHTAEVLDLATKAGRILLENGAEIYRVEETMQRIAEHYGEEKENFFVLSNGIFTTGRSYSQVEFIPIKGSRLDRVVEVNQLSREIERENITVKEADERLDRINSAPDKPVWEQLLGAVIGCVGFCVIFGGGIMDCVASLIAGLFLYLFILYVGGRYMTKPLSNICGGLLGTVICMLLYQAGIGSSLANMIIGTVILLIPGVAFTNGLRDIAGEDYLAGTTRLLDSLMVFFCIASGVSLTFIAHGWLFGGMMQLSGTTTDSITSNFIIQCVSAFVGTYGFAILFGVPRRLYSSSALVGMVGWIAYLLTVRYTSLGGVVGTMVAASCVALLSRFYAIWKKSPSTVFLICGIFPLIPGAGVFWSAYYTVSQQFNLAFSTGFKAVEATIAIVLSIIIISNIFRMRTN